jgi:hypothetical protein
MVVSVSKYIWIRSTSFGRPGTSIGTGPMIHSQRHCQKSTRIFVKPGSGSETPTQEELNAIKNAVTLKLRLAEHLGSAFSLMIGSLKVLLYRSP